MSLPQQFPNLTSGRLLARSTVWNLLGQILPMAIGLLAIPPLVRGFGVDRFGLLSLAWILIGYFSLFDLGIGRAVTKLIADKLATNEYAAIPTLVWTSLVLMLVLGVGGGLIMAVTAPTVVHKVLKIPSALQPEALRSVFLLSTAVPVVTITAGLRGILEAQQQFRILNLIRIPMSLFSLAGPLLVLPFSQRITGAVGILVLGRLVGGIAHVIAAFHTMPALRESFLLKRSLISPLLKFGSWMTVSSLITPLMAYMDRFLIGAFLSLSAVTYYATPFDVITRLWVIPWAASGALFPALAMTLLQDRTRAGLLLVRGTKYVFLAIFPIVLAVVIFAPEILRLWLGPVFVQNSSSVLRLLSAGVLLTCLAHMPFTLIQSAGRPDLTAKFHLVELPIYVVVLLALLKSQGLPGAALAFVIRGGFDAVVLFFLAHRLLPQPSRFLFKLAAATFVGLFVLYAGTFPATASVKLAICLAGFLVLAVVGGCWALTPDERAFLLVRFRKTNRTLEAGASCAERSETL